MTTDTKAVARFDAGSGVNPRENGKYLLFTDHELAVGKMEDRVVNMKSWARHDRELIEVLETELETLRTALAASRAEVEGLRRLIPMLKHSGHEWANLSACAAAKRNSHWKKHSNAIGSRDSAKKKFLSLLKEMEKGNG